MSYRRSAASTYISRRSTPRRRPTAPCSGVFAEFERSVIVERVNAGLARAKAHGVKLGRGNRKDDRRSADEERWGMSRAKLEGQIRKLHKDGIGILKIGRTLGVGTSVVQRAVKEQPRPFEVASA
jgi:DNA invertase Pin-like site-specific DNA recombinase